ncbi:protein OS-9-like protein [Gossypium australe]|uniref:Protein OS-9-like protein n=1 Tax=Gossypium australe TaxID=47621 RepID=A0A5B6WXC3_9ROSI|nr:protein OS-9-like protein [Gossypium australe]
MRLFITLVAAVLCILCINVFADPVFPSHIAGTFGHSSREPKYKIEFHTEDSPYHPDDGQESVVMPNKDGNNFLCFLPKVGKAKKSVTHQNTSSMIVETEKRVKLKTPDELLEVLKNQCFIRQEGWWSYEFCYQKQLRQLHLEEDKVAFNTIYLRLFQEERPVWHTINCNILPKDYKDNKVDDTHFTMIIDSDDPSTYSTK